MKLLFSALIGYLACGSHTEEEYWAGWKKFLELESARERHNFYNTKAEHDKRFEIFKKSMDIIKEHNKGGHSWTMGITQFADMTSQEFKDYIACGSLKHKLSKTVHHTPADWGQNNTNASIDWVAKGAVTPVKNQASCGSCWAFSTTGAIEGRYFIAKGQLNSLSEQDLVDCSKQNAGCNGGLMDYAFAFVEKNGGLCSEEAYPYVAKEHWRCEEDGCSKEDPITDYRDVTKSTSALESACHDGPVAVAIEADQGAFQLYSGGVLTGRCGVSLDHGVLLVGYGTDGANDYWKVKNSWGTDWGEAGYFRLCRNCNANNGQGQCGILLSASYPIV